MAFGSSLSIILHGCAIIFIWMIVKTEGHGMMLDPVGRASRWRYNSSAPTNYDDNQLFCGGLWRQWHVNNGKCGLCGDDFSSPTPRQHEIGGKYGEGVIVKAYKVGNLIPVGIKITANHKGYFYYHLCDLERNEKETELCYKRYPLRLIDNGFKFYVRSHLPGWYNMTVRLPKGLTCTHCVLRWTYHAGNNWGICPNGTGAVGCGPQETFRSCADIRINDKKQLNRVKTDDKYTKDEVLSIPREKEENIVKRIIIKTNEVLNNFEKEIKDIIKRWKIKYHLENKEYTSNEEKNIGKEHGQNEYEGTEDSDKSDRNNNDEEEEKLGSQQGLENNFGLNIPVIPVIISNNLED